MKRLEGSSNIFLLLSFFKSEQSFKYRFTVFFSCLKIYLTIAYVYCFSSQSKYREKIQVHNFLPRSVVS